MSNFGSSKNYSNSNSNKNDNEELPKDRKEADARIKQLKSPRELPDNKGTNNNNTNNVSQTEGLLLHLNSNKPIFSNSNNNSSLVNNANHNSNRLGNC